VGGHGASQRVEESHGQDAAEPLRPARRGLTRREQVDAGRAADPLAELRDVAAAQHPEQHAIHDEQQRENGIHGQVEDPVVGLDGRAQVPGQDPVAQQEHGKDADERRPEPPATHCESKDRQDQEDGHEPSLEKLDQHDSSSDSFQVFGEAAASIWAPPNMEAHPSQPGSQPEYR